jgi:hypothetical protein
MLLERICEIGGKFVVGKEKKSSHRVEDRLLRSNKFNNLQIQNKSEINSNDFSFFYLSRYVSTLNSNCG